MKKAIGIIGFGNMGSAIGGGLKERYKVSVFDKDKNKTRNLTGIKLAKNIKDLVTRVDVVILAVKPQDFDSILSEIKDYVQDKLVISIAAGRTTSYIQKSLGDVRVVRVMPNIEIMIGRGIVFVCKGKFATKKDAHFVRSLFNYMGRTIVISEDKIDAATAISGSRLAYYCAEIEKKKIDFHNIPKKIEHIFESELEKAAKSLGFNDMVARTMSIGTGPSCQIFFENKKITPGELREKITSKKGTTEAALKEFRKSGSWIKAVKAALKRARELSRG
ncbi:MAG: pyrroline-5-carboxylate reductase [Candidatus Omnitrophica bacterium]|nr:pyrroline-5-carboxylate reductase [Candidatus Omnitrophota bacterium]MDD5593049.1 pyrroline-5-carboxylate reductase [Candidatus Omnitrophota bacterium]